LRGKLINLVQKKYCQSQRLLATKVPTQHGSKNFRRQCVLRRLWLLFRECLACKVTTLGRTWQLQKRIIDRNNVVGRRTCRMYPNEICHTSTIAFRTSESRRRSASLSRDLPFDRFSTTSRGTLRREALLSPSLLLPGRAFMSPIPSSCLQ
jgi:hypothetical protein